MGTSCDLLGTSSTETAAVQEACKHQLLAKETTDVSLLHGGVTSGSSTLLWASITESWSGTGTEGVKRDLQELAPHKTV